MPALGTGEQTAWPPGRPTSTSQPCARAAPTSGTSSPTTCCPPGSPTWISVSPRAIAEALDAARPQPGIRLRGARGRAGRRVRPPHAAPLRLADRSRRRAPHRRSGAGQLLLGHGVQRAGRRGAAATAVLSAVHGRDQRHRPPPDRQPHARQRHALGARPRRLRGRTRSARPRADLLPSAEPDRPRLQPRGTRSRWRRSPSVTT